MRTSPISLKVLPLSMHLALCTAAGCTDDSTADAPAAEDTSGATGTSTAPEAVSYAADVAPIFLNRCTQCHHDNAAIGIDIVDPFAAPNGLVGSVNTWAVAYPEGMTPALNVDPGNVEESFLVHKISDPNIDTAVAGDFMPLNLPRLTEQEIADLRAWIDAGAANDDVFQDVIRPIFGDETRLGRRGGKCTYCHHSFSGGTPPNLTDPFDPDTGAVGVPSIFNPDLMRIAPRDADNSVLVLKVEATEPGPLGAPMPLHFQPLTPTEIATVEAWIAEGAQDN